MGAMQGGMPQPNIGQMPQTGAGQAPAPTQPVQPNVFQQSSQAYTDALAGTRAGMSANTPMVGAQQARATGYNPAQARAMMTGSTGYNASQVAGASPVTAQNVTGQTIADNMGVYKNPYEQQVVDASLKDLERSRQMQQNQVEAQATQANAFGGSRHGIAEAETNRAFAEQAGDLASKLRMQGFNTQAQLGGQDAQARQQAMLANQQAGLQADTTTAQQQLQAQLANQGALNTAGQFGAQAQNQASMANQQAANQMAQANMQAQNQAGQFGAGARNQASLANQSANLQASLANQGVRQADINRMMSGASQLGNLSNLGFGFGNTLNQNQMNAGNQQQALMQQLINAGRGQFEGYANSPQQSLNTLISALTGSNQGQQSQVNSRNLGLTDVATSLALMGYGR